MRAAFLTEHTGPEGLIVGEMPRPRPLEGEVLIQVHATAVTPTEFEWSPTFQSRSGEPRQFPIVLSHEFSGVIEQIGEGVKSVHPGDSVYGFNDWFSNGAEAEYCTAPATSVSTKPNSLGHVEASAVPISALTAWQGLFDRCNLQPKERALIHGGAGGVGLFAVQLAHWRGAHVLATASSQNVDFVRSLGADEVIDYKAARFESVARDVDVVFDAVGGETLDRSWGVLGPNGRLATIAAQSEGTRDERARNAFFIVEPKRDQLGRVAQLIDAGILRVYVAEVFELGAVREAYAAGRRGSKRGKIVLKVRDNG